MQWQLSLHFWDSTPTIGHNGNEDLRLNVEVPKMVSQSIHFQIFSEVMFILYIVFPCDHFQSCRYLMIHRVSHNYD